jgi:ribosomal protein S18 acetylase RimI-like enzyme
MAFISESTVSDAAEILALQKLAFHSEAVRYDDFAMPPMVQSIDDLRRTFEDHVFLKAIVDDRLVGSVRACQDGQTCYVGRLVVHPDFQRSGIGTDLMERIEARLPHAERLEIFTGHKSEHTQRLYTRLGYREFKRELVSPTTTLVFMEKLRGR